jgi:hypothetical protein
MTNSDLEQGPALQGRHPGDLYEMAHDLLDATFQVTPAANGDVRVNAVLAAHSGRFAPLLNKRECIKDAGSWRTSKFV